MQKILIVGIFSLLSIGLSGQQKNLGYTPERITLIEDLFNKECNGTQNYCDCIISGVTSRIPFNELRDSESTEIINKIIRECQESYKQFPYDPSSPPRLEINTSVIFSNRADSTFFEGDTIFLQYSISNEGIGVAYVPSLILSVDGSDLNDFDYEKRIELPDLAPNEEGSGIQQIIGSHIVSSDDLSITVDVVDGNNYKSNVEIIQISAVSSDELNKSISFYAKPSFDRTKYQVEFTFKNIGKAPIRSPRFYFELDEAVIVSKDPWISFTNENDQHEFTYDLYSYPLPQQNKVSVMYPGEEIKGEFQFTLKQGYDNEVVKLHSIMKDADDWEFTKLSTINVRNTLTDQIVNIKQFESSRSIYMPTSEVDEIEKSEPQRDNHFAVVVGNEKYSSADNVDYAEHDAQTFKRYCTNILGVPEDQVELVENGSAVEMKRAINNVIRRAQQENSPVIYFYYAGHGWPEPKTNEALLIPVDVGINQLDDALNLNNIMASFREIDDAELLAFVDACYASEKFSDNTRTLVRKIKVPLVKGNQVLFSAVSKEQEANKHEESAHGVFTYYLLETLKEEKNLSVDKLQREIRKKVVNYTTKKGQKEQNPSVHIDPDIKSKSDKWPVRKK